MALSTPARIQFSIDVPAEPNALLWQERLLSGPPLTVRARLFAMALSTLAREGVVAATMPIIAEVAGLHLQTAYVARAQLFERGAIAVVRSDIRGSIIMLTQQVAS